MQISDANLELIRKRPQSTELFLSVFQPRIAFRCRVDDTLIAKGERTIDYDTIIEGSYLDVEPGMVLCVGTLANPKSLGKTRVKSITVAHIVVAENSDVEWANNALLTVYRYFEVLPVYPRIIQDPADPEKVIFYKDYDVEYDDQNSVLGAFPNMGSHRAAFLEGGSAQLWYTSSGTSALQAGTTFAYDWAFEGGDPTGSVSDHPGYVVYNTPGHYVTKLMVSGSNGAMETSYRYVSIYNQMESGTSLPFQRWSLENLAGSRDEGGYTASIILHETVDETLIEEGSVIVIFSRDYYGSTKISLGGNQENNSSIFFVGHVLDGSIQYDYSTSTVRFDVGSITRYLQQMVGFSISVESNNAPDTWYELQQMDMERAIYHFLKWQSTVLLTTDVSYVGTNPQLQYFDSDRSSIYDAIDNVVRSAVVGKAVSDRQGKIWVEPDITISETGTYRTTMQMTNRDWANSPVIDELTTPALSYLEMGGIQYDPSGTGTVAARMACSPGEAPSYRGAMEQTQGLALNSQAHLNQIVGNLFAFRNYKYQSIEMDLAGSYRNIDIAPQESLNIIIDPADTNRNVTIHMDFNPNSLTYIYDPVSKLLLASTSVIPVVNGDVVETMPIPDIPIDPGGGGYNAPKLPEFPSGTVGMMAGVTYTFSIDTPIVGGVPGPLMNIPRTATNISAYCVGGTSVTFNIESRNAIGAAGTDIAASDLVASTSGVSSGLLSSALPAGNWLWLDISAVDGAVEKFVVTLALVYP